MRRMLDAIGGSFVAPPVTPATPAALMNPGPDLLTAARFLRERGVENSSQAIALGMEVAKLAKRVWQTANPGRPLADMPRTYVDEFDGTHTVRALAYPREQESLMEQAWDIVRSRRTA
jgi:hypothetical protein